MVRHARFVFLLHATVISACADEAPRKAITEPSEESGTDAAFALRDAAITERGHEPDVNRKDAAGRETGALDAGRDDGIIDAGLRDAAELDATISDARPDAPMATDASVDAADAMTGRLIPKWGVASDRCRIPRDCFDVSSLVITTRACCTEAIACGMRLIAPASLRDQLLVTALEITPPPGVEPGRICLSNESVFTSLPPQPDNMRVKAPQGREVLISKECNSASMVGLVYPGCCQPNGRCGLSTYTLNDTLAVLAPAPEPFDEVECVSAAELNAQLRATPLEGWGHLVSNDAPCDYEGTYASTPPAEF